MTEIGGIPAHILLVHAVVVLLPLAALLIIVSGLIPALRKRLGFAPAVLAVVVAILVPITASAGNWLLPRVGNPPLAVEHAHLGATLWYWSTAMAVAAVVLYLWQRRQDRKPAAQRGPKAVTVVLVVIALAVSVGAVVRTVQVGDSGSRSVWEDNYRSD